MAQIAAAGLMVKLCVTSSAGAQNGDAWPTCEAVTEQVPAAIGVRNPVDESTVQTDGVVER